MEIVELIFFTKLKLGQSWKKKKIAKKYKNYFKRNELFECSRKNQIVR